MFPRPYTGERPRSPSAVASYQDRQRQLPTSPRVATTNYARSPSLSLSNGRSGDYRISPAPQSATRSTSPVNTTRSNTPIVDLTQSPPSQPTRISRPSVSPSPSNFTLSISSTSPSPPAMSGWPRPHLSGGSSRSGASRRRNAPHERPRVLEDGTKRLRMTPSTQHLNHSSQSQPNVYHRFNSGRTTPISELVDFENSRQDLSELDAVDLTQVDGPAELTNTLAKQREDAVKAQMDMAKLTDEGGRTSLTSYKCPVCMDTPEDATVTVCGKSAIS